jgi:ABC-type glycerol-3-phosphate transport system substrate-binding protein
LAQSISFNIYLTFLFMKKFAVALLLSVVTLALVGCGAATPATPEVTTPTTTPVVEPTVPATETPVTEVPATEVPAVK